MNFQLSVWYTFIVGESKFRLNLRRNFAIYAIYISIKLYCNYNPGYKNKMIPF